MHPNNQLDGRRPLVDRRRNRSHDDSPLAMLARLPALRVLSQLPVPILAVARDGAILFANHAMASMLGYEEHAVTSLSFADVFRTAADEECAVSVIREHADKLVDLSHAEGAVIRAVMSRSALQRSDDDVALITFQDLTERLWLEGR